MANFSFSDKHFTNGAFSREVFITYNNIIITLNKDKSGNWILFLYVLKSVFDSEKYIMDIHISEKIALNIIKEAKEYQAFLYENQIY